MKESSIVCGERERDRNMCLCVLEERDRDREREKGLFVAYTDRMNKRYCFGVKKLIKEK